MTAGEQSGESRSATAPWSAVWVIAVGAFALITTEFLPVALLPHIAADVGVSEGSAGLMVTIPGFLAAASALVTTAFAGGLDRRNVIWVLLSLLVLSNLIVATAPSFAILLVGRVLLGIGLGGFWTIAASLGPRLRPGDEGGRANSVIFSGVSLGTVAGVPAGSLLGDLLGWRLAFACAAVVAAGVVIAVLVLVPSLRPERSSGLSGVPLVMKRRRAQLGLVSLVLLFGGQFAAYTYITPFLAETSGIEAATLSAVLLAYGGAGLAGNLFAGSFATRNARGSVGITAALVAAGITLIVATGSNPMLAAVAMLIWGFGFGMLPISLQSFMFESAPDQIEAAAALYVSVGQVAIGGGALIGGLIADGLGLSSALLIGAYAAIATLALVFVFGRGRAEVRRAPGPATTSGQGR